VNCSSVSLLDFCDAAALILSTVAIQYLLIQVHLSFVGTSFKIITAHTLLCRIVGVIIRSMVRQTFV